MLTKHLFAALVFAAFIYPDTAAAQDREVKGVVDFSKEGEAQKQAENLRGILSGPDKVVYLDLTILPETHDDKPDYRVTRTMAKTGAVQDVKCGDGWQRFSGEPSVFSFNFSGVDNHLLLSIDHADAMAAPYSTIACEYMAEAVDRPVFVVRGYFAKSLLSIPTAVDVELRPVSP